VGKTRRGKKGVKREARGFEYFEPMPPGRLWYNATSEAVVHLRKMNDRRKEKKGGLRWMKR
jgi:hypothetical protein